MGMLKKHILFVLKRTYSFKCEKFLFPKTEVKPCQSKKYYTGDAKQINLNTIEKNPKESSKAIMKNNVILNSKLPISCHESKQNTVQNSRSFLHWKCYRVISGHSGWVRSV